MSASLPFNTIPSSAEDTRLRGQVAVAARAGSLFLILVGLGIFLVVAFPLLVTAFDTPCSADSCAITPQQAQAVIHLGVSLQSLGVFVAVIYSLYVGIAVVIAGIVLWRRGNDWMALLVALMLVMYPISNVLSDFLAAESGFLLRVSVAVYLLGSSLFYLVLALFPSGRLVPRWLIAPVLGWIALHMLDLWAYQFPDWLTGLIYLALYASIIVSQIYRFRRRSNVIQQQQTKWVVFGIVIALLISIVYWQPLAFIPAVQQPDSLYPVFGFLIYQLLLLIIPLSFAVAILRFRLYDIDLIINRTLVYGSLTAALALIYFGTIITAQTVLRIVTGQTEQPTLVLVASTLLIAALFQPLRRGFQRVIDRRFYRRKYDTAQTVATFSATLRNEVDTISLSDHLLIVVEETMQPAHLSLWLRPSAQDAR